jgi:hypothetical protein
LSRSLEGLVGQIRHVVNVEDSFTRMNLEREPERKAHQAKYETALEAKQKKAAARAALNDAFYNCLQKPTRRSAAKPLKVR